MFKWNFNCVLNFPKDVVLWMSLGRSFHRIMARGRKLHFKVSKDTFIFHENANFLFSVFREVQGEAKNTKNKGVLQGNFGIFTCPKDWHVSWKMNIRMSVQNVTFRLPGFFFLINNKLAFFIVSQQPLAVTAKKNWIGAQNCAKNIFLLLWLETYSAWSFLFLCSFLNNYPWTFEKIRFQQAMSIKSGAKTKKLGVAWWKVGQTWHRDNCTHAKKVQQK